MMSDDSKSVNGDSTGSFRNVPEERFGYHLTTKAAALQMRAEGLTTSQHRTKTTLAAPTGAFVRNRNLMLPTKTLDRCKRFLTFLIAPQQIGTNAIYLTDCSTVRTPPFEPAGLDVGVDRITLDAWADHIFAEVLLRFPDHGSPFPKQNTEYFSMYKSEPLKEMAAHLLRANPCNVLSRLALAWATGYYRLEELQTCTHVYFSQPAHAVPTYESYKKVLESENGSGGLVVLRADVSACGAIQDKSDPNALSVKGNVQVELLEVMEEHVGFHDRDRRNNVSKWKPLALLT